MSADTIKEYRDFIARKSLVAKAVGFAPASLPDRLFKHQRAGVDFALGIGRAAIWYDTGLGKSGVEAVFAELASKESRKPALILTPLAAWRNRCAGSVPRSALNRALSGMLRKLAQASISPITSASAGLILPCSALSGWTKAAF